MKGCLDKTGRHAQRRGNGEVCGGTEEGNDYNFLCLLSFKGNNRADFEDDGQQVKFWMLKLSYISNYLFLCFKNQILSDSTCM